MTMSSVALGYPCLIRSFRLNFPKFYALVGAARYQRFPVKVHKHRPQGALVGFDSVYQCRRWDVSAFRPESDLREV